MHTVVIIGRPNVGKSTLFNRLIGSRQAIVEDLPGVTRDRIYGTVDWNGQQLELIDTGGFIPRSDELFARAIREQAEIAMRESSAIIFMVDVTTGITSLDDEVARLLRPSKKPVILVVNKVDNFSREVEGAEFYKLGFENIFSVSSISGSGTGELLDCLVGLLPQDDADDTQDTLPRFAVVGQPNTGKSTLVNALLGEDRNIVTDIAGTTRDSLNTTYRQFGKAFELIDTAGLRKKAATKENVEFYSTLRAINSIDESDVCMLLIDATQGLTAQDLNIFSLAERRGKGIVLLVNKWDLIEKETNTAKEAEAAIRQRLKPFSDVPIVFISAKEKQRIHKALDEAQRVYANLNRRVSTAQLNKWLRNSMEKRQPPAYRGQYVKIKYATQLPSRSRVFALFANHPDDIPEAYSNYLVNRLREEFDFSGVPLKIVFRKK